MRFIDAGGAEDLSRVFVLELADGCLVECAESVQPPVPREEKWVLIVSTLKGCPVRCPICDAGGDYRGKLSTGEILAQIDFLVRRRFLDGAVPVAKFKVQFARMGDPAFNDDVLAVLRRLPALYDAPGLVPCISTIAPKGRERFFEELIDIKNALYSRGRFQMQFSIHSTCESARRRLIPAPVWSFSRIADYGMRFFAQGDRKVVLNFAPARGLPLDPARLSECFSREHFAVKLTPINPTCAAARAGLDGLIDPADPAASEKHAERFREAGFETILSIGEPDENRIGSNCGMRARAKRNREKNE
ncbi:MAG: radical SAM protein [Candidatus Latescibacterota bacterium]|jgi:23S rRNA (adenine2503-C2)-methyltransferase|nr:MAG: radical SAM protein [Candidatus Latescibacterota bacterium]